MSGIGAMVSSEELAEDLTGTEILLERHWVWATKATATDHMTSQPSLIL